jgi:hypothetical protein
MSATRKSTAKGTRRHERCMEHPYRRVSFRDARIPRADGGASRTRPTASSRTRWAARSATRRWYRARASISGMSARSRCSPRSPASGRSRCRSLRIRRRWRPRRQATSSRSVRPTSSISTWAAPRRRSSRTARAPRSCASRKRRSASSRPIRRAVKMPVTVKMRMGWDEEHINVVELARRAEAAGVDAIAVHGRTREQFYRGKAGLGHHPPRQGGRARARHRQRRRAHL